MNEYQIYAMAGIAVAGLVVDRIIEYNNKRKLAPILESIKNRPSQIEATITNLERQSNL